MSKRLNDFTASQTKETALICTFRPSPSLEGVYKNGAFVRPDTEFRYFISLEPGALFPPERGRYHLYVSYACPWGM